MLYTSTLKSGGGMKNTLCFWLLILAAVSLALSSCSPVEDTPGPGEEEIIPGTPPGDPLASPSAGGPQLIALGEEVYINQCLACHQQDGSGMGQVYPALDGNQFVTGDPQPVIEIVLYGEGAMPAFGRILTDEETAAVVSFIRQAWSNRADFVTLELVQSVRR
jgi:mono/diheme cytochrome c family protein